MSQWWSIGIALLALILSVISFVWNWRHSESVFRRTEYPAVAWHRPVISKSGKNTSISVVVCNHGPREIADIRLGTFLCRIFKTEAWCKLDPIMEVPIDEELKIIITENLEEDIKERFADLYYNGSWYFKGKPKNYKTTFWFEYQPLIADAQSIVMKNYYLLKPLLKNNAIYSWQIVPISRLRSLLPFS